MIRFVAPEVARDRHRSSSQHGLTEAILGESIFAIDSPSTALNYGV